MKTLLCIDSSPRGGRSFSRQLTTQFSQTWSRANQGGSVIHREVGLTPVPSVTEDWIAAAFSPSFDRSRAQQIAISLSDELVDELISADDVVIGAPMYNFSITAGLKAWIDQIVRVGRTVEYPSYTGLLTGKSAVIIATRGGAGMGLGEPMEGLDAQVPYLRQIL